jgi:hypothetical protein
MGEGLSARYVLEYTYRRSVGPVLGRFLADLQAGKITGVKSKSGVHVPPNEGAPGEVVEVATRGVVTSWTWVSEPSALHPLDKPFAFALVKLDGADTALLHAVDAGDESRMKSGMRVRARFRAARAGSIRDLECFEPEAT